MVLSLCHSTESHLCELLKKLLALRNPVILCCCWQRLQLVVVAVDVAHSWQFRWFFQSPLPKPVCDLFQWESICGGHGAISSAEHNNQRPVETKLKASFRAISYQLQQWHLTVATRHSTGVANSHSTRAKPRVDHPSLWGDMNREPRNSPKKEWTNWCTRLLNNPCGEGPRLKCATTAAITSGLLLDISYLCLVSPPPCIISGWYFVSKSWSIQFWQWWWTSGLSPFCRVSRKTLTTWSCDNSVGGRDAG